MSVRQLLPRRPLPRALVTPLMAFVVVATFACGLDKLTTPTTPQQAAASLNASVTGDTTVAMGGTLPLHVTTSQGALASTIGVIWTSSKPTVATVDSSTGLVTGVGLGTVTISATVVAPELGSVPATSLTIRVKYAGIKITAVDSLIAIGMTKAIVVSGTNPSGTAIAPIAFSAAMTVISRDTTLFTISSAGALIAVKNGSAKVFVQFDGMKDSTTVKVRQVTRAMTFPAANSAGELAIGSLNKARTLAVAALDSLGVAIAAPTVTWGSSDNTTVSVVAATGVATALKAGTATITATSDGLAKPILARVIQVPGLLTKTATSDGLSSVVNTNVAVPPEVTVADSGGAILSGVAVTFAVTSGGGAVAGATPTSAAVTGKAAITSWTLGTTAGANTVVATAGAASATFTATGTFGPAKKLAFIVQPSAASAATAIAPPIQIAVVDSLNNVVTNATTSITVAVGANPGAATLTGTLTVPAVNGIASFADLKLSAAGAGYTLLASATGLSAATSNPFNIFGAPAKVVFTTQPQNGRSNQTLSAIKVSVQDAGGNLVANATNSVVVAITTGTGINGAILSGTKTVVAVNGVAAFSTLSIDQFGATAYTLTATSGTLTSGVSGTFTIAKVGAPAKLAFVAQPTNAVSGATISPSIQIVVQDSGGATVDTATSAITLGIETNPGSGSLSGTVTVNAISGVATFSTISVNKAGTGYKLNAITGTLTKGVSSTFNITAGAAFKLGFIAQPPEAVTGTTLSPAVQVAVQDAAGNTVATATNSITLGVTAGTGGTGATLVGGGAVSAINGVATFSGLSISTLGSNYTITATATGLSNGVSQPFNIVAANAAIKLGFTVQPSNGTSGTAVPQFTVAIQDASGNTITAAPATQITLTFGSGSPSGATATGAIVTTSAGVATFSSTFIPVAGSGYTLIATAPGLNPGTSAAFNVTFGPKNKLVYLTQPTDITAGTPFSPAIQVAIADAAGNTVTSSSDVLQLFACASSACSTLSGTSSTAAVNGVATFTNLAANTVGTWALSTNDNGQFSGTSVNFAVTAGAPAALVFKTQPQSFTAGGTFATPVQVQVNDAVGNLITTATNPITVGLASSPTGGGITGTTTVSAVSGVATFSTLSSTVAGFYQLSATATGLSSTTSGGYNVNVGAIAGVKWRVIPAGATANATLLNSGQSLRVDIVDANGNTVTNATNSVTVSITAATGTTGAVLSTAGNGLTLAAVSGQALYSDLKISKGGTAATSTAYKLHAVSGTLTTDDSPAFDIAFFGSANQWQFVQQPTASTASTALSPVVTAGVFDQFGNAVTSSTLSATLSFSSSLLSNVNLSGTTTVPAVSGVATFTGVSATGSQDALKLFASGSGLNGATSSAFNLSLFTSANNIYDGVIGNGFFFYIERSASGSVKKVDLSTGLVTTLANALNWPSALALDSGNGSSSVYWLEDGNGATNGTVVKRESVSGALNSYVTSGTLTNGYPLLQIDNPGNIFFIANNGTGRAIYKLSITFTAGTAPTVWFSSGCTNNTTCAPVFSIASGNQGSTMYYFTGGNQFFTTLTSATTPSTTIALNSVTSQPTSLWATSSSLYWSTATSIFAQAISLGSSANAATATNGTNITRVGFDGTSLFALDLGGSGTIRKYTSSGAIVGDLVTGGIALTTNNLLWLDGTSVFWSDNSSPPKLRRTSH